MKKFLILLAPIFFVLYYWYTSYNDNNMLIFSNFLILVIIMYDLNLSFKNKQKLIILKLNLILTLFGFFLGTLINDVLDNYLIGLIINIITLVIHVILHSLFILFNPKEEYSMDNYNKSLNALTFSPFIIFFLIGIIGQEAVAASFENYGMGTKIIIIGLCVLAIMFLFYKFLLKYLVCLKYMDDNKNKIVKKDIFLSGILLIIFIGILVLYEIKNIDINNAFCFCNIIILPLFYTIFMNCPSRDLGMMDLNGKDKALSNKQVINISDDDVTIIDNNKE